MGYDRSTARDQPVHGLACAFLLSLADGVQAPASALPRNILLIYFPLQRPQPFLCHVRSPGSPCSSVFEIAEDILKAGEAVDAGVDLVAELHHHIADHEIKQRNHGRGAVP